MDGSIKLPAYIKQKKFGKNMITHMIIPETDVSIKQSPKGDIVEYGGLELTAEAARFYTSGRARFTPPGGHILQ